MAPYVMMRCRVSWLGGQCWQQHASNQSWYMRAVCCTHEEGSPGFCNAQATGSGVHGEPARLEGVPYGALVCGAPEGGLLWPRLPCMHASLFACVPCACSSIPLSCTTLASIALQCHCLSVMCHVALQPARSPAMLMAAPCRPTVRPPLRPHGVPQLHVCGVHTKREAYRRTCCDDGDPCRPAAALIADLKSQAVQTTISPTQHAQL